MRNCIYTKHNRGQHKITNILFDIAATTYTIQFYESYIPNKQTNKQTNTTQTTKTTTSTWVLPLTQSLCSYYSDNANSGVFMFRFCNKSINFVHFIYHQFVPFINAKILVRSLMNNFVHFIHPYMNPLPNYNTCS